MSRAVTSTTLVTMLAAWSPGQPARPAAPASPDVAALQRSVGRFAPTDLAADLSGLSPGDRTALRHLVQAAQVMDALFLRQVWAGNESMFYELAGDDTPAAGRSTPRSLKSHFSSRCCSNSSMSSASPTRPEPRSLQTAGISLLSARLCLPSVPST